LAWALLVLVVVVLNLFFKINYYLSSHSKFEISPPSQKYQVRNTLTYRFLGLSSPAHLGHCRLIPASYPTRPCLSGYLVLGTINAEQKPLKPF